jgi:alpha 1,3-mannosyltransferase
MMFRQAVLVSIVITTLTCLYLWFSIPQSFRFKTTVIEGPTFETIRQEFISNPLGSDDFGKMGWRIQVLRKELEKLEKLSTSDSHYSISTVHKTEVEDLALSMFPWLTVPSKPTKLPIKKLRESFITNSRGIVIPVGIKQFRFAAHLIASLRTVLNSTLPIQVAYAGDADLPIKYREALASLGLNVEMLDVTSVFNNDLLKLQGSWAIKPFALLACKFEQAILLDADAVMVQDPAVVFSYAGYKETGTFLFHDRLLWQHAFQDRHEWWKNQTANHKSSAALSKSLVWNEDYAEEQDSGMIAMDKRRLGLVTALLHICWQNSLPIREQMTYKITYGDKESWWFGLELSGVEYTFEDSYGSIAGYLEDKKVCSFTIAHPCANDKTKLLWYNGSLLKNKEVSTTEFTVPQFWMRDAVWEKGGSKPEMSCMRDGAVLKVRPDQVEVLERSVRAAERIDDLFSALI